MNDRTPQESGARDMPPRIDARLLGLAADALAAAICYTTHEGFGGLAK